MGSYDTIKRFVLRYERHLSVAAMAFGFILDNAFLERIDAMSGLLLLFFYFVSSGLLIIGIHLADSRSYEWLTKSRPWLPFAFQVIIGSWFSAFLVFYSRSASTSTSWPFLIILFVLFAGTEVFRRYQERLAFQNAMYFFCMFSFATSLLPLVLGRIGTAEFLLAGLASVVIFGMFFALLYVIGPARLKAARGRVLTSVAFVFVIINALYFSHLLPPLPLSLRDIGVYHSIVRTNAGYDAEGESASWVSHFLGNETVHVTPGGAVYIFSSVFTPVAIQTDLVHRWQCWDDAQKKWVTASVISFPLSGGRDQGYRGFSEIPGIPEGKWQVSVETPSGALVGRISFSVLYVSAEPPLVQSVL